MRWKRKDEELKTIKSKDMIKELRFSMETQFRYKFYRSTEFPFLPSIGIKHVLQGFEAPNEEIGYIGMLHLWWTPEDPGIDYDVKRDYVKGIWRGEWFDTPMEGLSMAKGIQDEQKKVYDDNKLWEVHINHNKEVLKRIEARKKDQEEIELDNEEDIVYN